MHPMTHFCHTKQTCRLFRHGVNEYGVRIIVAVIDTGVAVGGEDAPVNVVAGYDFVNNDTNAADDEGHGTHVAGTIALPQTTVSGQWAYLQM